MDFITDLFRPVTRRPKQIAVSLFDNATISNQENYFKKRRFVQLKPSFFSYISNNNKIDLF